MKKNNRIRHSRNIGTGFERLRRAGYPKYGFRHKRGSHGKSGGYKCSLTGGNYSKPCERNKCGSRYFL